MTGSPTPRRGRSGWPQCPKPSTDGNLVLTDEQGRAVVAAAYDVSAAFGLLRRNACRDRRAQLANRLARCRRPAARRDAEAHDAVELEGQEPHDADPQADADHARVGEAVEAGRSRTRCR